MAAGAAVWPVAAAGIVAPEVGSAALVEDAGQWDGRVITFTGEAIGSAMIRGESAWLHLNDDPYGVSDGDRPPLAGYNSGHAVLVPARLARQVKHFGSYGTRGDVVTVTGTFRAADPQYGGDMLIEATTLEVIREGRRLESAIPGWKLGWLGVLIVTTSAAYASLKIRRRHFSGS